MTRIRPIQLLLAAAAMLLAAGCARLSPEEALRQAADAISTGRWHLAEELTGRCLEAAPANLEALILQGIAQYELHRPKDAVASLEKAVEIAPNRFAPHYFLGWVLAESGDYGEALKPLREAHRLNPEHGDTLILLGRCCLEQNLATEGIQHLGALRAKPIFKQSPALSSALYNGLACLLLTQGHYQGASANLVRALEKAPQNPVILQNLAVLHDQYLQDPVQALHYYRYCISACQAAGDSGRQALVQLRLRQLARQRRGSSEAVNGE